MYKQLDLWLTKILNIILVLMLLVATLIMFINVVLRYVLASGLTGAFELVILLIITITFIGASLLITDNEHLTMDAIVTILPDYLKRIFEVIVCLIGIAFSAVLLVYSIKVMEVLGGTQMPILPLPSNLPYIPMAFGFLITIMKYIYRLGLLINQFKRVEDN